MTAQAQAIAPNGAPRLNDDRLFRPQCYIDGAWVDADSGATFVAWALLRYERIYQPTPV